MSFVLTYKCFGERSILIEWPSKINPDILQDILRFKSGIENNHIKQVVDLRHAYNSLLVIYDFFSIDFKNEAEILKTIYLTKNNSKKEASKLWRIPVCYDVIFGIDLDFISEEKKQAKNLVVKQHSEVVYTIYFIGFLPGFLYLGGLNEALFTPRKSTPRLKIEKGAVAIGGKQTGVYPQESPGGWNIIGNSPINFFDNSKKQPCFAKAGDKLQFYSISLKEHHNIKALVAAKVYQLESEVIHD